MSPPRGAPWPRAQSPPALRTAARILACLHRMSSGSHSEERWGEEKRNQHYGQLQQHRPHEAVLSNENAVTPYTRRNADADSPPTPNHSKHASAVHPRVGSDSAVIAPHHPYLKATATLASSPWQQHNQKGGDFGGDKKSFVG